MSEVKAILSIDGKKQIILIEGFNGKSVGINYSGDVDFTELVELLTDLIDDNININLEFPKDYGEDKVSIVLETIKEIVQKYNDSITAIDDSGQVEIDVDEEDDLPF